MTRIAAVLVALCLTLLSAGQALAQDFPALSGRVVDSADIISAPVEAELTAELAALETQSQRQFVIATVADLEGYDVADYGYRLGRHWGIGDKDRDDGVLLLIAPNQRRMHIAVGYGLEPVLTDALSSSIIRNDITPAFRNGDFDGGIRAGATAIIRQLQLPPEEAAAIAAAAGREGSGDDVDWVPIIFWLIVFTVFIFIPLINGLRSGSRKYRGRRGSSAPIIVWGGGDWGGGSSWGGGGSSWGGGGFGGFSGGGGSFGGGGASGGW